MPFERVRQPLASSRVFAIRLAQSALFAAVLVAASLGVGMAGYHGFEHMSWIDAFANASMILSGMGPLAPLNSTGGKLFAGFYALYSGLVLVAAASLVLAPLLHRFLHRLHIDESDEGPQAQA